MINKMELRFSSIKDFFTEKNTVLNYTMKVPYTDTYRVTFKKLASVAIYDDNHQLIKEASDTFEIFLNQDQIVKVVLNKGNGNTCDVKIMALHHKAVMPYEPYQQLNTRKLRTHGDASKDPLTPAIIKSVKRDDGLGLYINCNNPEKLTQHDIGKALSRVNVSNKKVFFTFEHNNLDEPFYYGYQVKNTGKEDLYITVLNMGLHLDGPGCWLGEKEWIDFYNVNFRFDGSKWTDKQKESFKDFFNFSNQYKAPKNQPITYRIPSGKYIYVMGGTTKDAYKHINVWKTADKVVNGGCSNGVVLFDVIGEAEGSFFVYTNPNQIKNNTSHQGYVVQRDGHDYGSQYVGYDNCHGVVDTHLLYTFNDLTKPQDLPVTFTNYYVDELPKEKIPYLKLNSVAHQQTLNYFASHMNPQNAHDVVGTDMTKYYTINDKGEEICIDADHLDGHGNVSNIGNWMMDYMDYYTFVNQGDQDREVTIDMRNTGSICVFIRDKNGKLTRFAPQFTIMHTSLNGPEYSIKDHFEYTIKIKAHSIKQFIIEYNLLANSCGYVVRKTKLK